LIGIWVYCKNSKSLTNAGVGREMRKHVDDPIELYKYLLGVQKIIKANEADQLTTRPDENLPYGKRQVHKLPNFVTLTEAVLIGRKNQLNKIILRDVMRNLKDEVDIELDD
jgi:hypothetical protein